LFLGRHLKTPGLVVVPVSLKVFLGKIAPCNGLFVAARAIVEERIALAPRTLAGAVVPLGERWIQRFLECRLVSFPVKEGGLPPELLTVNTTSHFSDDGKLVCAF